MELHYISTIGFLLIVYFCFILFVETVFCYAIHWLVKIDMQARLAFKLQKKKHKSRKVTGGEKIEEIRIYEQKRHTFFTETIRQTPRHTGHKDHTQTHMQTGEVKSKGSYLWPQGHIYAKSI